MQTDDFEKRLSSLTLRQPSPSYSDKGHVIIREQTRSRSRHAVYLNYALALSLLLSLGINLLLLAGYREDVRELTAQCEINAALQAPDKHPRNLQATLKVADPTTIEKQPPHFC